MRHHAELGGVILSGLLRTAVWLSLFCVVAFDAGGMITNRVLLDEAVRVAAVHAAESARAATGRAAPNSVALARAREAAEDSLEDQPGIQLLDIGFADGHVVLVASRRARVLVADRIPPLRRHVDVEATSAAPLAP